MSTKTTKNKINRIAGKKLPRDCLGPVSSASHLRRCVWAGVAVSLQETPPLPSVGTTPMTPQIISESPDGSALLAASGSDSTTPGQQMAPPTYAPMRFARRVAGAGRSLGGGAGGGVSPAVTPSPLTPRYGRLLRRARRRGYGGGNREQMGNAARQFSKFLVRCGCRQWCV